MNIRWPKRSSNRRQWGGDVTKDGVTVDKFAIVPEKVSSGRLASGRRVQLAQRRVIGMFGILVDPRRERPFPQSASCALATMSAQNSCWCSSRSRLGNLHVILDFRAE